MAALQRDGAGRNDEGAEIGVGIIGTGAIANAHAIAINANPHAEMVGFAEIREGVAEAFAERYGVQVPIFADYRELLAMDGLDAVVVSTSNDVHASISIAAAEAGKHVLCEKPMTTDIADARAMVAAAEKAGVRSMIGYTKRFFRGTRFLHDFLRREKLGRVYHIRAFYLQSWLSNPGTPMVWRLQSERTGTGVLGDLGAHITDLAQSLVGDDITRVTGMMKTFVDQRPGTVDAQKKETVDVDDACMYGAEFKNGAMGVFEASRNGTGRPDHWRIEIDAEKGAVIYDSVDRTVKLSLAEGPARRAGWIELPIPARYGADGVEFQNEFAHFVDCIRSGETPKPSFADGFKTERVLDAVARSCQAGAAVDVEA